MAQVRVSLAKAASGQLPPVCICCGAPAVRTVNHDFYYMPAWLIVGRLVMGYLIAVLAGAYRKVNLVVPVCQRHQYRLKLPTFFTYAVLLWLLMGVVLSIGVGALMGGEHSEAVGFAALAFFLPVIPMLIGVIVMQFLTPRAENFDSQTVSLTGVSTQFAQALGGGGQYGAPAGFAPSSFPAYGAAQPAYGAAQPRPAMNPAGAYGAAPRPKSGGFSPVMIMLIIGGVFAGVAVVFCGGGLLVIGLAFQNKRAPVASTSPTSPPPWSTSASPPTPSVSPFPSTPSIPSAPSRTMPRGSSFTPPSVGPGGPSFGPGGPRVGPGGTNFGSGGPSFGPGGPSFGPGGPSFGPPPGFPGSPSGIPTPTGIPSSPGGPAERQETVAASPDFSGRATKFPPDTAPLAAGERLASGTKIWALWGSSWWRGEVLEATPDEGAKIHYAGYTAAFDEVLPAAKLLRADVSKTATAVESKPAAPPDKPVVAASPVLRTWSDATGKFKIEAEFVSVEGPIVHLKKPDGSPSAIPLDKLSQADQDYIKGLGAGS